MSKGIWLVHLPRDYHYYNGNRKLYFQEQINILTGQYCKEVYYDYWEFSNLSTFKRFL